MGGDVVVVAGAAVVVVAGVRDLVAFCVSPGAAPQAASTMTPPAASPRNSAGRLPEHVAVPADVPITLPEPSLPALAEEKNALSQHFGTSRPARGPDRLHHTLNADGQMSLRMHTSHWGLRALHTRRPCRIRRSDSAPRSSGSTIPSRSSSIFTGSVSFVSFSRRTRRITW